MNPELRTKPTVEAGIKFQQDQDHGSAVVEYQPGNGTRYLVVLADIRDEEAARVLGCPCPATCFTFPLTGKSIILGWDDDILHWVYVKEKLGCSFPDAVVLTELLAHLLNIDAELPPVAA